MNRILPLIAVLTLAAPCFAGMEGVPGVRAGSGGSIPSIAARDAVVRVNGNVPDPGLYKRIASMPGAQKRADGTVKSPPIQVSRGVFVGGIVVDPSGRIVTGFAD
jgi:hypothetical protein